MPRLTRRSLQPSSSSCTSWSLLKRCWRRYRDSAHPVPTQPTRPIGLDVILSPLRPPAPRGLGHEDISRSSLACACSRQALEMPCSQCLAMGNPLMGTCPLAPESQEMLQSSALGPRSNTWVSVADRAEAKSSLWFQWLACFFLPEPYFSIYWRKMGLRVGEAWEGPVRTICCKWPGPCLVP